jgi:hypothetical protein
VDQEKTRRRAVTRPWRAAGTLLCQIAWLRPLRKGPVASIRKAQVATNPTLARAPPRIWVSE